MLNLHLSNVTFESGALEGLISGCPLLEKLSIQFCEGFEYFDISVTTLKVLLLQFHQEMKSICLKKAINLIDLTLKATNGCVCIWFDQKFTKKHSKAFYWSMTRCLQVCIVKREAMLNFDRWSNPIFMLKVIIFHMHRCSMQISFLKRC